MEDDGEQEIWSWGAGTDGQLGTGRLEDETLPQLLRIASLSSGAVVSSVSCGGAHVIALTAGGGVLTWGRGNSGQLGLGDMVSSLEPKPVVGLEGCFITHVSAGWSHSGFVSGCCGAQVYGFGAGKRGQLGISNKIQSVNLPVLSSELEAAEIVGIAAAGDHSAALSTDGRLFTWGRGFGTNSDAFSPQYLPSPLSFRKVALGWNHALVLTDEGELYMLGGKHHGTLSDSERLNVTNSLPGATEEDNFRAVCGIKILDIAAGAEHSAVVTEDGAVKTWGWGEHGQLGLGDTCDHTNPQTVTLRRKLESAAFDVKVYSGSGFTVAITTPHAAAKLTN
ncbi:ultraviolet-B receptor UVR8 isoform X2 [Cucurbita moschata]|uniref:Ultraviolet-B receptor UVR8 isoform X2 n=1 Tax=Cucurbita moschata TaxID=3662 RepID=A0A6J1FZJ2_CUCMO|nr:ultraviolet-B receptor UVR8 isoform X2 [Cucurbita moschata]